MTRYTNHFKLWNEQEEHLLLLEISNGMSIEDISKLHDRSQRAITMRLCDIAVKLHEKGISDDMIYKMTTITCEVYSQRISEKNNEKLMKQNKNKVCDDLLSQLIKEVKILHTEVHRLNNLLQDSKLFEMNINN